MFSKKMDTNFRYDRYARNIDVLNTFRYGFLDMRGGEN